MQTRSSSKVQTPSVRQRMFQVMPPSHLFRVSTNRGECARINKSSRIRARRGVVSIFFTVFECCTSIARVSFEYFEGASIAPRVRFECPKNSRRMLHERPRIGSECTTNAPNVPRMRLECLECCPNAARMPFDFSKKRINRSRPEPQHQSSSSH